MSFTISGHCEHCSWDDRYVFHPGAVCPSFPIIAADADFNGVHPDGDISRLTCSLSSFSRRPSLGDRVLLVCNDDDPPFACWGTVERIYHVYGDLVDVVLSDGGIAR